MKCTHILHVAPPYARTSVRLCTGLGGAYGPVGVRWCVCDISNINMPTWLGWEWLAGCPSMVRTLLDLWGGHGVNLRDQCVTM